MVFLRESEIIYLLQTYEFVQQTGVLMLLESRLNFNLYRNGVLLFYYRSSVKSSGTNNFTTRSKPASICLPAQLNWYKYSVCCLE